MLPLKKNRQGTSFRCLLPELGNGSIGSGNACCGSLPACSALFSYRENPERLFFFRTMLYF
jgi:hypothetical protein